MGSALSQQEELFLRRQWPELLEDAMSRDLEELTDAAASPMDSVTADDQNSYGRRQETSSPRGKADKKKRNDGFRLSFQEWQALLAVLEQTEAKSDNTTPSDIAARLTAAQLHVPVVSLLVHFCVWWRGAITNAALNDRLDKLIKLVEQKQHAHVPAENEESVGPVAAQTSPTPEATAEATAAPSPSRRARLARFVQRQVVSRSKRSAGSGNDASSSARSADAILMDAFVDMTCLAHRLLSQSSADAALGTTAAVTVTDRQVKEVVEGYDAKISDAAEMKQRPVLAVVMVMVLAIFTASSPSQSHDAARRVTQLQSLEQMFLQESSPPRGEAKQKGSTTLAVRWPILTALVVALAHGQHVADVRQCAAADGEELIKTLLKMRRNREKLHRDKDGGTAPNGQAAVASPPARWSRGASQYIGQRHIWSQMRSHFLSAGVFDADKPTVLVFFGPSGYGKSELARRVASVLHDCPMSELEMSGKLVYIHMPSFCTKDSIYSLVDPPAAHVGSGILLSALQKHPDAVVVLDEFEKSTAEAINNLWLSAFQKNGVLRSLKEASRSVSTVRTTFVLTCNTCADSITAREGLYLTSGAAAQETIRSLFITQCKDVCRETMGDPFVNRVDYFFPFMPYTRAERRQFVCLLLERLLAGQAEKGRHMYATPAFVEAMVDELRTFHAATLEEALRGQVMTMVQAGWTSAVLTVERQLSGCVVVLLPMTRGNAAAAELLQQQQQDARRGSEELDRFGSHSLLAEAWESLPGGEECCRKWESELTAAGGTTSVASTSPPPEEDDGATPSAEAGSVPSERTKKTETRSLPVSTVAAVTAMAAPQAAGEPSLELEKEYEHDYAKNTERIVELEKELEHTRELLKQRDMEIVTLKDKILVLQKVLAVVTLALLATLFVMTLVVGVELTMVLALSTLTVVVLVLGVPLAVLLEAVQALFRVLGPFKAGALLLFLGLWMTRALRATPSCS